VSKKGNTTFEIKVKVKKKEHQDAPFPQVTHAILGTVTHYRICNGHGGINI
jgi:hypothetical protein